MKKYTATDAKTRFGEVLDDAQRGPVLIEKKGRPIGVMLAYEDFEAAEAYKLQLLRHDVAAGVAQLDAGLGKEFDPEGLKARIARRFEDETKSNS